MRLIIGLLLLGGGGLAALAVAWFFYSTSDPSNSNAQTDVSVSEPEQTAETKPASLNAGTQQAKGDKATETTSDTILPQLVIDVARIGPDGSAVIAGTAPPETEIRLLDGVQPLTKTLSNSKGEWVAVPDTLLRPGNHLIIAEMTDENGQIIRAERGILIELADKEGQKPLVALVPMTDDAATEILSAPETLDLADANELNKENTGETKAVNAEVLAQKEITAILVMPPEIATGTLSWSDNNQLRIKGRSNGGVSVSGSFAGNTFRDIAFKEDGDEAGNWSALVSVPDLKKGRALIETNLLDLDGSIVLTSQVELDLAQLEIGLDGSEMVIIRKGDMLWRIAYRTYGSGIRYLDIVKRNARQIHDPDLIYPAQIFALPETEDNGQ
jgi:nucleoid-associated protein YgaU